MEQKIFLKIFNLKKKRLETKSGRISALLMNSEIRPDLISNLIFPFQFDCDL